MLHHYLFSSTFMLHAVQSTLPVSYLLILTIILMGQLYSYPPVKLENN